MGGTIVSAGLAAAAIGEQHEKDKQRNAYYGRLAQEADAQAGEEAVRTEKQNQYLLSSAAEKAHTVYQNYQQRIGSQKASLASAGLNAHSVTVQNLLKNSRLQALLTTRQIEQDMQGDIQENTEQGALRVRKLKETARNYRNYQGSNYYSLIPRIVSLFGGR